MNTEEIIEVLKNELECVKRQFGSMCDNKRDCGKCDLTLSDKEIISAYENAIQVVESVDNLKHQLTGKEKLIHSLNECYKISKYCGELETIQDLMKFCRHKLNSDSYTDDFKAGVHGVYEYLECLEKCGE